jgi:hypothetical protein
LLLARFPQATADELREAHAYAYAGCILQDMGYYPFGSKLFSDLVHYVRSGDFVMNLLKESSDLDEFAFSLGALAHYAADTQGHSIAVNRSVPIEYPKLKRKYGDVITYEEDKAAHIKVEFGFDVLQVARGNYAPNSYHDFIGFKVAKGVLDRAFYDTYSLHLKDVFHDLDLALGTYRHTVSGIMPLMTKAAWDIKKNDLIKNTPGLTRKKFVYNLSRASYHKEWDGKYEHPGIGARILAFVIRILPKIGPLRALSFKPPTPATDKLFQESFNRTMDEYRGLMKEYSANQLRLANRDFDTGAITKPSEYRMADETYAKLAIRLAEHKETLVDPTLRDDVLAFFKDLNLPFEMKSKDPKLWNQTITAVEQLKASSMAAATGE